MYLNMQLYQNDPTKEAWGITVVRDYTYVYIIYIEDGILKCNRILNQPGSDTWEPIDNGGIASANKLPSGFEKFRYTQPSAIYKAFYEQSSGSLKDIIYVTYNRNNTPALAKYDINTEKWTVFEGSQSPFYGYGNMIMRLYRNPFASTGTLYAIGVSTSKNKITVFKLNQNNDTWSKAAEVSVNAEQGFDDMQLLPFIDAQGNHTDDILIFKIGTFNYCYKYTASSNSLAFYSVNNIPNGLSAGYALDQNKRYIGIATTESANKTYSNTYSWDYNLQSNPTVTTREWGDFESSTIYRPINPPEFCDVFVTYGHRTGWGLLPNRYPNIEYFIPTLCNFDTKSFVAQKNFKFTFPFNMDIETAMTLDIASTYISVDSSDEHGVIFVASVKNPQTGKYNIYTNYPLNIGGAKQDREAPSVPVATVITENSITWVSDGGSIVVCNGEEKPSGSTWTGLIPGTTYTAYAYFPETDVYNRSPDSETASVTTLKFEQSAPSKPQAISVTENSITWISDGGSIIECNGEEKPSGSTWTGLEPDTTYTARAYFPETDIYYRSPYSEYGVAITLKPERLPPDTPIVSELTARTVVLTSSPGSIIVCNNQEKPSGSTWTWLTPGNVYEAYAYFPESQGETRSPNSEKTIFTTLQSSVDEEVIITGIMTDGTPASTDLLRNALILSASNDCVEISNNQILAVKSGTCRITFSVEGKITYMDIIIP